MTFTELNLKEELLDALYYMGFDNATPIQEQAIPIILENRDIIACAQTGTGKTGAFLLPILNKLVNRKETAVDTVIVAPTRELAIQIDQQIQGLAYFLNVGSQTVYGGGSGSDWEDEKKALKNGTDIIVATPGKLLSHLRNGYVNFKQVKHFVLDEADRMLNMGFIDDLNKIMSFLPKERQNILFSATMPPKIEQLARKTLVNPAKIALAISKPAEGVKQGVYLTYDNQKEKLLTHILNNRKEYDSIIIFTSAKAKVNEIVRTLKKEGFTAQGISSNLEQKDREEALRGFRSKRIRIVVATDVMSRGIDIKEINMVINFDVPHDAEDYVHRVGRTARANTKGEAITLVNPRDMLKFNDIEKLIETEFEKQQPPKELGEGPKWSTSKPKFGKKKKFFKKKKPPTN